MAKVPNKAGYQELAARMRAVSLARTASARATAYREFAASLTQHNQATSFLGKVLSNPEINSRRFGLEIAARLQPLPPVLIPNLILLVSKRKFPASLRIAVAGNIINHLLGNSEWIPKVLAALEYKTQPLQAAERLNRLLEYTPLQMIVDRRQELLERSLSLCPRCGVRLQQAEFIRHLWEAHQLRFEAGRVQEPWQQIEEWVNQFRQNRVAAILDRSCELAQLLDPRNGIRRVHRLLTRDATRADEHATLREIAAEHQASICPHCYDMVPFSQTTEPTPLILAGGLLSGHGLRAEVSEGVIFNWLKLEHQEKVLINVPEPGRTLTRRGVVFLLILPLVLLACVFAVLPPINGVAPVLPVAGALFVAAVFYMAIRMRWDHLEPPSDRVLDHTWDALVPRMVANPQLGVADQLLLAGIAEASANHGDADHRDEIVRRALSQAYLSDWSDATVAGLQYLLIEDRDETTDDLLLITERFTDFCSGQATWGAANRLLRLVKGDLSDQRRRARLRVLLLKGAFTAGLEPKDLHALGRLANEVGECYASEDLVGLARLRLLWIYRENRLWQRIGSAASVFDLAQYAQSYMAQRPDLLLLQPAINSDDNPILICEEGVVYRDSVLTSMDDRVAVRTKTPEPIYELILNQERYTFTTNPEPLAKRLRQWCEFLFAEFLPRAESFEQKSSPLGKKLLDQHARACQSCRQPFYGLPGETGLLLSMLDEEAE